MRLREFYDRVTEGMALRDLWNQFKVEAESGYRLYSQEVDWESFEKLSVGRRLFKISGAFFWAMLMYLSPVRRVLLLISLGFFVLGIAPRPDNSPPLAFYGGLGLLIVLALELADRVIMKRDLQIAREIQRWLVPEVPPRLKEVDIAFTTRPANTVGGDFYDVILSEDERAGRRLLLVVADVAGKSVPAALLMATFQASLRALTASGPSLKALAAGVNRGACGRSQGGRRFTTAFLGEIALETRRLTYINAGHNHPILRRRTGELQRLSCGGLPFGIEPAAEYQIQEVDLATGDSLVMFTDGVVEAVNASGEEFGDERLLSLVKALPNAGATDCLEALKRPVDEFVGSTRQHDDMTWMLIRIA